MTRKEMSAADKKYVCTLSAELLERAKKELNEDPKTRHLEIKTLRERLDKVPGEKFTTLVFGGFTVILPTGRQTDACTHARTVMHTTTRTDTHTHTHARTRHARTHTHAARTHA